jgi:hypothetical protein
MKIAKDRGTDVGRARFPGGVDTDTARMRRVLFRNEIRKVPAGGAAMD